MNYIAIIGDIIDSRNLRDRNQVQKKLMDQLGKINRLYSDDIKADFKITLGDEFQGLMYSESKAPIEVICKLAQMLYPVKIRFGIGVGDISTKIIENQPAMMDGPCFHMARKAITKLKENEGKKEVADSLMAIEFSHDTAYGMVANSLLMLISNLMDGWTAKMAATINAYEENDCSQQRAADVLGVNRTTVVRSLKSAKYYAYCNAKKAISKLIKEEVTVV